MFKLKTRIRNLDRRIRLRIKDKILGNRAFQEKLSEVYEKTTQQSFDQFISPEGNFEKFVNAYATKLKFFESTENKIVFFEEMKRLSLKMQRPDFVAVFDELLLKLKPESSLLRNELVGYYERLTQEAIGNNENYKVEYYQARVRQLAQ
jgi:hypothetical protein